MGITATFVAQSVECTAVLILLLVRKAYSCWIGQLGTSTSWPKVHVSVLLVNHIGQWFVCLFAKIQVNFCSSVSVQNELNQPPSCGPINPRVLTCCEAVHLLSPQPVCSSQKQEAWITYGAYSPTSTVTYRHLCTLYLVLQILTIRRLAKIKGL